MTANRNPLLNPHFRWFLFAMILANIASEMVFALLPVYLTSLNASVAEVGLVYTAASLVPVVLQILGGWLSDNIGRLRTIAIGSLAASFGYLAFFAAPSWQWVLLGLCVEYISGSLVGPSFSAYVAEQSSEEERGRIFGVSKAIFMIVTVIGPALAGFLAFRWGFKLMLLVSLVLYVSATGLRVWMAIGEHRRRRMASGGPSLQSFRIQMSAMFALLVAGGLVTWIWVTDAVGDTAFNMIGQLYPIYLADIGRLNIEQIGLMRSAIGAATIFSTLACGWLVDRFSERAVIVAGFFVEGLGLVLFLQASSFAFFLAAMIVFGTGTGAFIPAYDALVSKAVPPDKRGLAFGLFGTSLGVLSLPMPWIGGQLWQRVGPQTPFWVTIAAEVISIPIAWLKFRLPKKEPLPQE